MVQISISDCNLHKNTLTFSAKFCTLVARLNQEIYLSVTISSNLYHKIYQMTLTSPHIPSHKFTSIIWSILNNLPNQLSRSTNRFSINKLHVVRQLIFKKTIQKTSIYLLTLFLVKTSTGRNKQKLFVLILLLLIEDIDYLINLYQANMATSELCKSIASTMKKVAALPRYRHPGDLINMDVRPVRQQRLQIDGKLQFGANLYPSDLQQKLIQAVLPSRTSYRTSSVVNKSQIASIEYQAWETYLQGRVANLTDAQVLVGERREKLHQSFLIGKERNQQQMQLGKTVKLFYHLSTGHKFDVAIHPLVLMRMVYPYYGYLINYTEQRLTFDDYLKFLEEMIAVSQLFYEGSTLHGSELLSFVFWKAYTNRPTLSTPQFCKFLTLFKFDVKPENLTKQFEYHLKNRNGEITEGGPIRFDFWRNLYLERGL